MVERVIGTIKNNTILKTPYQSLDEMEKIELNSYRSIILIEDTVR
jgi:hypothetical protein